MKKIMLYAVWIGLSVLTSNASAQGTFIFNNVANSNPSISATSGGLVFVSYDSSHTLLNQDINFELFAGQDASSLQPVAKWLLVDNSAAGISVGGGHFADPKATIFTVPGVTAGSSAFFQIGAWVGNYSSFNEALQNGAPSATIRFTNPTGDSALTAATLVNMPAFNLQAIPEPTGVVILALGFGVLLNRSWKKTVKGN